MGWRQDGNFFHGTTWIEKHLFPIITLPSRLSPYPPLEGIQTLFIVVTSAKACKVHIIWKLQLWLIMIQWLSWSGQNSDQSSIFQNFCLLVRLCKWAKQEFKDINIPLHFRSAVILLHLPQECGYKPGKTFRICKWTKVFFIYISEVVINFVFLIFLCILMFLMVLLS